MKKKLAEIHSHLLGVEDFQSALAGVVKNAATVLGLETVSLRLLNPLTQTLEVVATVGLSKTYLQKGPVGLEKSLLDREALAGKPVIISDIAGDSRFQYPEEAKREGLIGLICVPLMAEKKALGVLRAYTRKPYKFSQNEVKILLAFAQQAATALSNAKLYQRMKILAEIAREISSILELPSVLDFVVESAARTMGAKGSSLHLLDEKKKTLELRASFGLSQAFLDKGFSESDQNVREALAGRPTTLPDAAADPRLAQREAAQKEGVRTVINIPLILRDKVIGLLRVQMAGLYDFSREDSEFLMALAAQSATAIENARLYEHVKKDYTDLMSDLSRWYGWGDKGPARKI